MITLHVNRRLFSSPDEHLHPSHRMNPSRSAVESPSGHFQRVDMQNHQVKCFDQVFKCMESV